MDTKRSAFFLFAKSQRVCKSSVLSFDHETESPVRVYTTLYP